MSERSMILTKCPTTGKVVSTGMASTEESFKSNNYGENEFQCSACGQVHTWAQRDAWVGGTTPKGMA